MSRRNAREQAMVLLYQCDLRKKKPMEIWNEFQCLSDFGEDAIPLEKCDEKFVLAELEGVWEHLQEIDDTIGRNSRKWEVGRLSATVRAILRIAVYEMNYREDIPSPVSVNEAVELAKNYDNPEAGSLVNGILAGVLKE